ncbi:MAG: Y-family DNA polymerase [Eubacterium ventriosum]
MDTVKLQRSKKDEKKIDIRNIPAIIGGDREKRHGIVLAKSISAKKFGIVTGEPIANALQKCPNILIVPPEHGYYNEQSHKLMNLLRTFTPDIEQVSVDECYMDFSGIQNEYPSPLACAYKIKDTVKEKLGFTVNVGISDVKVLAKMASDFTKPDKVHTLYRREIKEKMWQLPVEELYMAGKSSVNTLHKLGIYNIGQLATSPEYILEAHLKKHGKILWEYANGIDKSVVNTKREELKGVGNSITLPYDLDNMEEIEKILLQLSEKVAGRLRKGKQMAKTVAVEVKYNDFIKASRQTTLDRCTDSGTEIYQLSKELFRELWEKDGNKSVRLLGIRTANLEEQGALEQMSIMDIMAQTTNKQQNATTNISREKMKKLDKALDAIKNKYGEDKIKRASLLAEQTVDMKNKKYYEE